MARNRTGSIGWIVPAVVKYKDVNEWAIPAIGKYFSYGKGKSNSVIIITKNVYGKPIRGRPARVIAQLIQMEILELYMQGKILGGFRWIAILALLAKIENQLRKWRNKSFTTKAGEDAPD